MPPTAGCGPALIRLTGREPVHASSARRRARVLLAAWDLGEQASVGELVVGELVSNAVCHGAAPIWVRLSAGGGQLRVEVHDGGDGRPARKNAGPGDEAGRGLELLDGLIELHGGERGVLSDPDGPGKTVYVALSLETTLASPR
jgi:two-component sensor histidine kinase